MALGNRLSIKEKVGYSLGDTASHFVWDMVGFWILIFYTDTFGISAAAAGTIMLIARFWDMASDPLMGIIADRTNTRWGKFRPYILWMALPYSVLAVLAFSTPDFGETGKVVYAGITYILLMTVFTAINLPYSSLGAVMTSDSYERAGLNSYRFIFAFVGQFIVSGTALYLANYFGKGDSAKGYQYTLILFSVISFILFMITFKTTRERVQPPAKQNSSLKEDFKNLLSNRPWIILFFVGIISFVMFALQNLSIAYYFKYYIGKEENVQLFNIVGTIALIVAIPASKPLSRRFGKRNVFIGSSLLSGLFFCLLYLPAENDVYLLYTFNILAKMSYAPAVPLLWTMLADTVDYSEWKSGRRATGLTFSAATFAQKAGWGIGGALAGWLLSAFHFEPNVAQTETAINGIKLMVSVFPGMLYMSGAILLFFYGIDHKTCVVMQAELEERRLKGDG
ncbi:glycoside/pentoside/hexuronide:cation symporter, GPH family [Mariniphaga anaerophila]|uniref:Glycoside/pentoside/hexuronide:cation symporter, GPH family n=1 Tax=Mariniphaga anaerophila TaxID=1484053 RepID=A0A1M4YS83_9BACT|nr:MFS transporter [Mariniphaga anaerophila]SHF08563.1 glycoside/pentoside/hexuronide:cation symporter, GPH family [Mariniphaga anaerophila]